MALRSPSVETIAWFVDLARKGQLDANPPYQRKSVWNQRYRDFFIDTILNGFPFPSIFLYREVDAEGNTTYHVVDGKQRLETILDYTDNLFLTPESYGGQATGYFKDLSATEKKAFWEYLVTVEFVTDTRETILKQIFDRINRNVAQLKPQELRHARYDGEFIQLCERLADVLPDKFPNISETDKRRMRDVEYISTLLLYLQRGPQSTSQADIDQAYADWDGSLPADVEFERRFLQTIESLKDLVTSRPEIASSRLHNLADFYSLFGAASDLVGLGWRPSPAAADRVMNLVGRVEEARLATPEGLNDPEARTYYEAARSASNDSGPRSVRIEIIKRCLAGA